MNTRHSSSKIPLPAGNPEAPAFPGRRLFPMQEGINGLPAYKNQMGKAFTARVLPHCSNGHVREFRIEIDEVVPDREGYKVRALLTVDSESVSISDIHNEVPGLPESFLPLYEKPPLCWRGFGFFEIILDQAKKIARESSLGTIDIVPANDELRRFYARQGFVTDPKSITGKMVYLVDGAAA